MEGLYEKIEYIVSYDLIGQGKLVLFDEMSLVDQRRFRKQCDRLFHVCNPLEGRLDRPNLSESEYRTGSANIDYINERYSSLVHLSALVTTPCSSGFEHRHRDVFSISSEI